ncbi:MAG: DUF4136 domain-containing protein [Burkholderiales bacterium]
MMLLLSRIRLLAVLMGLVWLAGCASVQQVSVDVSAFGGWPQGRAPGRYAIDRLPSQQQAGAVYGPVEAAARMTLESFGFQPASGSDSADVLVQVGARRARVLDPWAADMGWYGAGRYGWRGGPPGWPRGPFWGPGPMFPYDATYDQSEIALLLVDRASRQVLYEAHVRHESRLGGGAALLPSLFGAALQGFPQLVAGERRVTVPLTPASR